MGDTKYFRKSKITNIRYDIFNDIYKIVNIAQAEFYINHGVKLIDIIFSNDIKSNKKIVVFCFMKEDTKEVYDQWCKMSEKSS